MSELNRKIRQIRFEIKDCEDLELIIESSTGKHIRIRPKDGSLTGISGVTLDQISETDGIQLGGWIPAAKLKTADTEYSLGRMVIRRVETLESGETVLAFSTVDIRVPVDGLLSPYCTQEISDRKNPYEYELSPDKFTVASFKDHDKKNVDILSRCQQFSIFYEQWSKTSKYQHHNIREASQGSRVKLRQRRKDGRNDYLVMASNDYLGLSSHPEVVQSAKKALDAYGFGSTGSPLTTGITDLHEELTHVLKDLFKKEGVLLFNSGYTANVGALAGLTRENDLVLADFLSHASLQDGMGLSMAESRLFKHNNVEHLEKLLIENRDSHSGALVVTEGVFSMDGDIAPLKEIHAVAKKYNARLFLDEAHSFGVIGPTGLGLWEKHPDIPVDILMGTFSKICGTIGGFLAADQGVIEWLKWHARSHIFTVSIPPSTAAATLTALDIFRKTPQLLEQLRVNIKHFVHGLIALGAHMDPNHESAVVPVNIGNEMIVGKMNEVFRERGIYVIPVVYPAVGRNSSRFRFTIMATHTVSDIDYALNTIEMAMHKADFKFKTKAELEKEKEIQNKKKVA